MMKHVKAAFALFALSMISMGCEKESEPGPQGTQGEQGPPGGTTMEQFVDTLTYSAWTMNPDFTYSADISTPLITTDVLNNGVVMVLHWEGVSWQALPTPNYFFQYWENTVHLTHHNAGGLPTGQQIFKVVVMI